MLLVSSDFLVSDYCHDIEMRRALERHAERLAQVIPVIPRPCLWHSAAFGHLNAVPTDGKPYIPHFYKTGTQRLFSELSVAALQRFPISTRLAHFDTTSVNVFGEYRVIEGEEPPFNITHGCSKDKRPDLKQFVFSLLCVDLQRARQTPPQTPRARAASLALGGREDRQDLAGKDLLLPPRYRGRRRGAEHGLSS